MLTVKRCLDSNNVTRLKLFGDGGNLLIIEKWKKSQLAGDPCSFLLLN